MRPGAESDNHESPERVKSRENNENEQVIHQNLSHRTPTAVQNASKTGLFPELLNTPTAVADEESSSKKKHSIQRETISQKKPRLVSRKKRFISANEMGVLLDAADDEFGDGLVMDMDENEHEVSELNDCDIVGDNQFEFGGVQQDNEESLDKTQTDVGRFMNRNPGEEMFFAHPWNRKRISKYYSVSPPKQSLETVTRPRPYPHHVRNQRFIGPYYFKDTLAGHQASKSRRGWFSWMFGNTSNHFLPESEGIGYGATGSSSNSASTLLLPNEFGEEIHQLPPGHPLHPAAFKQKRRFSWKCLFLLFLLVLLLSASLTPIGLYVILPRYASSLMSSTSIRVNHVGISGNMHSGFMANMNITLTDLPSDFYTIVDGMLISVFDTDTQAELGQMKMPELVISKHQKELQMTFDTFFEIRDQANWINSMSNIIHNSKFGWELRGSTSIKVHPMGLAPLTISGVRFSNTMENDGMDGLKSVEILELTLPGNLNWSPDEPARDPEPGTFQGLKLLTQVQLFNPSQIEMQLGDVTFKLMYPLKDQDVPVGLMSVSSMTLSPGKNVLQMTGALLNPDTMPPEILSNISPKLMKEALSDLLNRFVHLEVVALKVSGWLLKNVFPADQPTTGEPDGSIYSWPRANDQINLRALDLNEPKWLESALRSLTLEIQHQENPEKPQTKIDDISISKMNFKIRAGKSYKPVVSATVNALLSVPFNFDLLVTKARQDIEVYRCIAARSENQTCTRQVLLGTLSTLWDPAETTPIYEFSHSTFRDTLRDFDDDDSEEDPVVRFYDLKVAMNNGTNTRGNSTFLKVPKTSEKSYKDFVRDLLIYPDILMKFKGMASAEILMGLGDLIFIRDLPFEKVLTLEGMPSLVEGGDLALKNVKNLEVANVLHGNEVHFRIPGSYLRRTNKQIGLVLESPLKFGLYYTPDPDPTGFSKKEPEPHEVQVGTITLPTLDLGDQANCLTELYEPLLNQNWTAPAGSVYCPVLPIGQFNEPSSDNDIELCSDRNRCVGRAFLSSYITNTALLNKPLRITLRAEDVPKDLELAKDTLIMPNISLPGYSSSYSIKRPPFPLVKRIIVKPTGSVLSGKLSAWLDLYNPFLINLRYYYIRVETYSGDSHIGTLHVNFTQYDPFEHKPGYQFLGYPERPDTDQSNDPYGPHPSGWCLANGDCQVGPIDLAAEGNKGPDCTDRYGINTTLTGRLDVQFIVSGPSAKSFWKSLWNKHGAKENVRLKGQVLLALNNEIYQGQTRHNEDRPTQEEIDKVKAGKMPKNLTDPYWFSERISKDSTVAVSWLDFGQSETEMTLLRFFNGDFPDTDVPDPPVGC